jgi:hypothetical protein
MRIPKAHVKTGITPEKSSTNHIVYKLIYKLLFPSSLNPPVNDGFLKPPIVSHQGKLAPVGRPPHRLDLEDKVGDISSRGEPESWRGHEEAMVDSPWIRWAMGKEKRDSWKVTGL